MPRLFSVMGLSASSVDVTRISATVTREADFVAVEEPLEIRIGRQTISITMRTPGDDPELAAGFLFAEGIVRSADDIAGIRHCGPSSHEGLCNTIRVDLAAGVEFDPGALKRNFLATSACGVCGRNSIDALKVRATAPLPETTVRSGVIRGLPASLRAAQTAFESTGGLHAAGLFTASGELVELREDVGRHNAVDKVIGARLLARSTPPSEALLMVSGRASYELAQKAIAAGVAVLAAVGAPSSLAVSLAKEMGMTLVGFVRSDRFNVYSGEWRIVRG